MQILPSAPDHFGRPRWVIYDPIRHKYFSIGQDVFTALINWKAQSVGSLVEALRAKNRYYTEIAIRKIADFLAANKLVIAATSATQHEEANRKSRKNWASRLTHGYLFFRIPLVRPDVFLRATYPLIAFLFSKVFRWMIGIVTLLGLYLTSRQWDAFTSTFVEYLSFEGIFYYGLALVGVKFFHELGHAYTAIRYGCRVPTMGIAFMVLMPLLYTDVTDAWRLKDKAQRLKIDAAGIFVELSLAGVATFLWAFLPDSPMRAACFFIATISWVMSLFVNLNPFMKFDGYHIMADGMGIPNLQARSSALGRWRLRKALFDIELKPTEAFEPNLRRILVFYAFGMWIYRFFLFLGIALLVYHMAFKALGIALFVIEILYFIALPIFKELKTWWLNRRSIIMQSRGRWTLGVTLLFLVASFIPFSTQFALPALVQPAEQTSLFPSAEGEIVAIHIRNGDRVEEGQVLFGITSAQLDYETERAKAQVELASLLLTRQVADRTALSQKKVLERRQGEALESLKGLHRSRELLTIKASKNGIITGIPSGLAVGNHVNATTKLATLHNPAKAEIVAFVDEENIGRFRPIDGLFVPRNPSSPKQEARYLEHENTGTAALVHGELASIYGGDIEVTIEQVNSRKILRPTKGQYRIQYAVAQNTAFGPGRVFVDAVPKSIAARFYERLIYVLVRESGF